MTITLELTIPEAAAVAVALNGLINEEPVGRISAGWQRDAIAVQSRLEILRDEAERSVG